MGVLPAYQAAKTLDDPVAEIPREIVDVMLLVDDASSDPTVDIAPRLKLKTIVHDRSAGYAGNQKTCYREALKLGGDITVSAGLLRDVSTHR